MSDEDIPPRVLAAEERRAARQAQEDGWTPQEAALIKVGTWDLRVPGAPQPTDDDLRLAAAEIEDVSDRLTKRWRRP